MRALIVQGMAFGDEGKGATVDWLTRRHGAPLGVRYNGGPQAAHNVVTPEGLHHTFAQFGSGTLAGADTHLSRFTLVDPLALQREAEVLRAKVSYDPYSRLTVDPDAVVVTRYHVAANRAREIARGAGRHGSVGAGVGEARRDQLAGVYVTVRMAKRGGDSLRDRIRLILERILLGLGETFRQNEEALSIFNSVAAVEVSQLAEELAESMRYIRPAVFSEAWGRALAARTIRGKGDAVVVLEGAQGVLLDERYGFAPYNSWTDCTFANADRALDDYGLSAEHRQRIGVFRSYFTRHGPGPFPTESEEVRHPEVHNSAHRWMGEFRQGRFDGVLAAYAAECARPDALVVTHMDRHLPGTPVCNRYDPMPSTRTAEAINQARPNYVRYEGDFLELVRAHCGVPVIATSAGPTWEDFREQAS